MSAFSPMWRRPSFSFSASPSPCWALFSSGAAERRAVRAAEPLAIKIDLSRPRDRRFWLFLSPAAWCCYSSPLSAAIRTYQVTESVQFCGQACHLPMEPQFVAAQHTAHARVECVACHVGPGCRRVFQNEAERRQAALSHRARMISTGRSMSRLTIPRPPQAICEQCHWPQTIRRQRRTHLSPLSFR